MVRLRLLCGPAISGVDPAAARRILQKPKLVALLAHLAQERRYVSRFTLLGLLWPELDEARGRSALRKAVHILRRELGGETLVSRGDSDVGLGPGAVWCDTEAFEDAIASGESSAALALYEGDLLPGFFVTGAAEFEWWLDSERARLRTAAEKCALGLAHAARLGGDFRGVLTWAERTREISRRSEDAMYLILDALVHLGERATALQEYSDYRAQLRAEFGIEPSQRIRELAASVRAPVAPSTPPADARHEQSARLPNGASRYERLVEHATDIIYEVDIRGRITQVNAAGPRVLGYSKDELLGRVYLDLVHEDYRELTLQFYMRQIEERRTSTYHELPVVHANGRTVWIGQNVELVEEDGEVTGAQAIARDVGAQMRTAEAQRNLALRDSVTDLYGPRGFHCMAEDRVKLARRTGRKLILVLIDVAATSDASTSHVLNRVAQLLERTLRATDVVARTGDHRFAVLSMEETGRSEADWMQIVAERLRGTACEQNWPSELAVTMRTAFFDAPELVDAQRLLSMCSAPALAPETRVLPFEAAVASA